MPSAEKYLEAAERLQAEGRLEDARFMAQQARRARLAAAEPPGPALEIPEVPAEPAPDRLLRPARIAQLRPLDHAPL